MINLKGKSKRGTLFCTGKYSEREFFMGTKSA
jgi:hypothetical protein